MAAGIDAVAQRVEAAQQQSGEMMATAMQALAEAVASMRDSTGLVAQAAQAMAAPKRIVTDAHGRAVGVEPVPPASVN